MVRFRLVFVPFFMVTSSAAQTPGDGNADESREEPPRRRAPVISPEIHEQGKVAFRLRAPEFSRVVLLGQWPEGRMEMTKDDSGLWSVTAGPSTQGFGNTASRRTALP